MTFLLGIFFALSLQVTPQASAPAELSAVVAPEIILNLKPPLVQGNSVKLGYEIPYPGYIEFHLFGPDGQKIWQNFGVQEKGEHYQAIKRSPLEDGVTYTYEFWYKGKPYKGSFKN